MGWKGCDSHLLYKLWDQHQQFLSNWAVLFFFVGEGVNDQLEFGV